jgi:hypothetical protein
MPAAAAIMLHSAMPQSKCRSGKAFLNIPGLGRRGEVGVEHDYVVVLAPELDERVAVALARSYLLYLSQSFDLPSVSYSSQAPSRAS